jgi:hypothetical protein
MDRNFVQYSVQVSRIKVEPMRSSKLASQRELRDTVRWIGMAETTMTETRLIGKGLERWSLSLALGFRSAYQGALSLPFRAMPESLTEQNSNNSRHEAHYDFSSTYPHMSTCSIMKTLSLYICIKTPRQLSPITFILSYS